MKSHSAANFEKLVRLDPDLALRLRALPWPDPRVRLAETRSGLATLAVRGMDGADLALHSEYDPRDEARRFLDARRPEAGDALAVCGFGMGYLALEAAARAGPRQWIACIEAREEIFRAAMEGADLSPLLGRERVRFIVGDDLPRFQEAARAFLSASEAMKITLLTWPPSLRAFPPFYAAAEAELETAVNRRTVELNTLVAHAEAMERNALRNIPALARARGVKDFEGVLAGLPAIVVAAGPSLNAALPLLKAARGRAAVVAAGKPLKLLLSEGIVPEFAVTLDMTEASASCFRGFSIPPEVALAFDPDAWYEVAREFAGPKVSYQSDIEIDRWSRSFLGDRGTIEKGLSVAHTAFYFARATGADPILLVGVDLAFPGDRTHAEGVTMTWGGSTEGLGVGWVEIPGVSGRPVRTLPAFKSFVTAFESAILSTRAKVVQTSEIGALIRGAETLPLAAAVERHLPRHAPVAERLQAAFARPPLFDPSAFEAASGAVLAEADRARELAEAGLRHVKRLRHLDPANKLERAEFQKHESRTNAARNDLLKLPALTPLLGRLLSDAALRMKELTREIEAAAASERAEGQLRQFEIFFEAYLQASEFFASELRAVRQEMVTHAS